MRRTPLSFLTCQLKKLNPAMYRESPVVQMAKAVQSERGLPLDPYDAVYGCFHGAR
jgi:hypothetical protein